MTRKVIIAFDDEYSGDNSFVHSYVTKFARDLGPACEYEIYLRSRYRGPKFNASLGRIKIIRQDSLSRINFYWASNFDRNSWKLLKALSQASPVDAIVCFSVDLQYAALVIRCTHLFYRNSIPQLIVVTPQLRADEAVHTDFKRLGALILQDARMPFSEKVHYDNGHHIGFNSDKAVVFHDDIAYPLQSNQKLQTIDWRNWISDHSQRPNPVKNIVLFIRPDWMRSGSGTTFEGLARYFRRSGALLIDIAIFPYLNPFTAKEIKENVSHQQKKIGSALYFTVRRSLNPLRYLRLLPSIGKWMPTTVSNQWLLFFGSAVMPAQLRYLVSKARVTHIYLNHFFTYLYAKPLIGNRHFLLDTHDLQAVNQFHHGYLNVITRRLDKFDDAIAHEMKVLEKARKLIFVSDVELEMAAKLLPREKMTQVIILPAIQPNRATTRDSIAPIKLLIVASDHPGNLRGLTWFLNYVWPEYRRLVSMDPQSSGPSVKIDIIGNITKSLNVKAYEVPIYEDVVFHGIVEEISEFYGQADVILLPVVSGGGIGIKTIEALLNEKPLIATSHAMRGLPQDMRELVPTFNTPEEFAIEINRLTSSKDAMSKRQREVTAAGQLLRKEPFISRLAAALDAVRLKVNKLNT